MFRYLAVTALLALAFCGCTKMYPADKVTYVADDDPRMKAAIEKARATVDKFIAAMKVLQPGQNSFSVKMASTDGKNTEHMWLTAISYDGTNFHGTVNNSPDKVNSVKMGQKATVAPSDISDWMYVDNGKLVGGFTLRVLRDALTPKERAEFDKSVQFTIE